MPAYRNRVWDGKIRLFSPSNGELYIGLLPYLKKYLDDFEEDYTVSEELEDEKKSTHTYLMDSLDNLTYDPMESLSNLVITKLVQWSSQLENIVLLLSPTVQVNRLLSTY